jgi:hypothetical protein
MIGRTNAVGAKRPNPIRQPTLAFNDLKKIYKAKKIHLRLIKELLIYFSRHSIYS